MAIYGDRLLWGQDDRQKFYANNPYQPYCQYLIPPKLNKLHKQFRELLKSHRG
jgi:peptide-methionine (S)-S-oxide reductase